MRDRLIEILTKSFDEQYEKRGLIIPQYTADYLLANGVMVVDSEVVTNLKPLQTMCGMPLDEVAELITAKEEGRLIVPPCKVGDTVYETDGVRIYESTIDEVTYYTNNVIYYTSGVAFDETAIGHSVFLTREEAERALKGEKQ